MAPLRALLLTPDFPPMGGGIQLVMHRLVDGLREIEIKVVTLGVPGAAAFDAASPVPVLRAATYGPRNRAPVALLNARGTVEGVRRRPDVLICGHAVAAPATALLRRIIGRPSLQYVHAEEFRDRASVAGFAVRHADAVVCVSRYGAALAAAGGARPERTHVIPPGVDPPARLGFPRADRPTIVTVARLREREKGHDVVLRALPLVLAEVPAAEWIVIGDGPLRPELEATAARLGVERAVRFLGRVSDGERDAWLERSHVFVLPNHTGEGFGIVFLEAASHGLPVVAGAVGGALDAVDDGRTGLLVDAADPAAVAGALVTLLRDDGRRAAMGEAGRERAGRFTWARHAAAVEELLGELARHRRAPRSPR